MNLSVLRIGLALSWGVIGLGFLTRSLWAGGALDARAPRLNLTLFGVVAVALAALNLYRVGTTRARRPRVNLAQEVANRRAR